MEKLNRVKIYIDEKIEKDSELWFYDGKLLRSLSNYNKTKSYEHSKMTYLCEMLLVINIDNVVIKDRSNPNNHNINNERITIEAFYKFKSGPAKDIICGYVGCVKGQTYNGKPIRMNRFSFNYLNDNLEPLPKYVAIENHEIYPPLYQYTNGYKNMFTVNLSQLKELIEKDNASA